MTETPNVVAYVSDNAKSISSETAPVAVDPIYPTPVVEPVAVVTEPIAVAPVVAETTAPSWRTKAIDLFHRFLDIAEVYAFEIFLGSLVLAVALFVILLPKIAFVSFVALAGSSGWIAYLGLKHKGKL